MRTVSIITICIVLSIISFVFIDQYFYYEYGYVYAFKPKNAPPDQTTNETITTTNISKEQQSSNNKGSLEIDKKITPLEKNISTYAFVTSLIIGDIIDGQFEDPSDIAIDSLDNVYVVDNWNHRIQKFDSNGNFITKWSSYGSDSRGQIVSPSGIAVDPLSGNVYVTDSWNDHIQVFAPTK